jgi:uncharacterized protein YbjT (DUF2867 family)
MIVVTAPTGQIGGQVVRQLLSQGADVRVVARDPSHLSSDVRSAVEAVAGSHGDPAVLREALDQASALFWLVPPDPKAPSVDEAYVGFTRPAVDVLPTTGVRHVVGISALGRGTPQAGDAGFVTATLAMDDLIATSGVAYRAVTNPSFFDNLLRQADPIRARGMFFSAVDPARKLPAVATRDIAATAARLLLDTSWDGVGHLAAMGPQDLSFDDMAEIMSEVLGAPIRCQRTSYDDYKAQFVGLGMSDAMAQGMTDMARAKSEGVDNGEPRTAQNTTPTSFRQWCEDELKPAVRAAS